MDLSHCTQEKTDYIIYLKMMTRLIYIKDFESYLDKRIQMILKNPSLLKSGRKLDRKIEILPREELGLFLVCAVGRFISQQDWRPASDHEGRDGLIVRLSHHRSKLIFATEQVYIPPFLTGNLTDLVLLKIQDKSSRGEAYGRDRHLIIYCDKQGLIEHQRIKKEIQKNDIFSSFWIIGKSSNNEWRYFVATPKSVGDPIRGYEVLIHNDFKSWSVTDLGAL